MKQRIILLAALLLCTLVGFTQQVDEPSVEIPYVEVLEEEIEMPFIPQEEPPMIFGSSDLSQFRKWVESRVVYPVVAYENGIQGSVYAKFTVGADGFITNVKIVRGVDPALDKETMRVLMLSPKWLPAKQNRLAVPYSMVLVVDFRLIY